ncbi:MAG: PEP-CTERM sorting domain-containing protein [Armatimonadetes bacterium]|nr:PEP-CTERM sorting domain-containing protein [Armatimonadota bacterium]
MKKLIASTILSVAFVAANASQLTVQSYEMPNGYTGSYYYWDKEYNGSGNTTQDGAYLSGGTGNLTDGVIANDNWFNVENLQGTGPYVGWVNLDPVIIVHFGSVVNINEIKLFMDDSDGAGGVNLPGSVEINGQDIPIGELAGSEPKLLDFVGFAQGDSITIQLHRKNAWVFMSEMQFFGDPVPEPATMSILGLGALGLLRKRNKKA